MTQLMSSLKLAAFPIAAMLLFLAVFVGVCWVWLSRRAGRVDEFAAIPLHDENTHPARSDTPPTTHASTHAR